MDRLKYLFVVTVLLITPVWAHAHGLVTTQSQTVGNFIVEFEYNTIGNIIASDYTLFDVYLLDSANREGIDFDSAFMRIVKKDGPAMLAGNLAQAADIKGFASLSGRLDEPGTYTAQASFYKDGKTLAESKFDFIVEQDQTSTTTDPANSKKPFYFSAFLFLAGLVLGAGGMRLVGVYRSSKN